MLFFKQIILFFISLAFFAACSSDEKSKDNNLSMPSASLTQGEKFKFDLKMLDSDSLNISVNNGKIDFDNQNKATLFVFFTTWCAPCIAEIPHLNKLQKQYQNDFDVIGVLLEDKSLDEINEFIVKNNISYRVANGENNYLLVKAVGGVSGIPTMYLYTKDKGLFNSYLGVIPGEMLEIEILKAIS